MLITLTLTDREVAVLYLRLDEPLHGRINPIIRGITEKLSEAIIRDGLRYNLGSKPMDLGDMEEL